jgi:hypothetical protein
MDEKVHYHRMTVASTGSAVSPRARLRRWRLVGLGLIMSTLSVLILLMGVNYPGGWSRPLFLIIGILATLFFVPMTAFLLYAAVRLGNRDRHATTDGSEQQMPLFGRNRQSPVDAWSLSANVEEEEECWRVTWFGNSGNQPPDFEAANLTEVTDVAATGALALYAAGPRPLGAVLAFAIYPRKPGKKGVLYDVSGSPGQFKARDMQNMAHQVDAANLEELIEAVRQQAGADIAMLRWVRPFAELPIEWLAQ